jgi:two-component system alkaline phosphatase synthesis response regulator PhoP
MSSIMLGNLTIDRDRFEATVEGRRIDLTFVEFELLYALARNAGKALSRDRLVAAVWQTPSDQTHRLTVHISRLRKKLHGSAPWQIETITKRGYILRNASAEEGANPFRARRGMTATGAHR